MMAKINLSYDTNNKKFLVDIDGKPVERVVGLSVYKYSDDDVELSMQLEPVKEDGMVIYQSVRANKNGELEHIKDEKKLQEDFNSWLSPQKQ